jgi:hypothetical protein
MVIVLPHSPKDQREEDGRADTRKPHRVDQEPNVLHGFLVFGLAYGFLNKIRLLCHFGYSSDFIRVAESTLFRQCQPREAKSVGGKLAVPSLFSQSETIPTSNQRSSGYRARQAASSNFLKPSTPPLSTTMRASRASSWPSYRATQPEPLRRPSASLPKMTSSTTS